MYKILFLRLFLLIAFLFFPLWAVNQFGDVSLEKIVFHLFVPMKNMPTDWLNNVWIPILLSTVSYILLIKYRKYVKKYSKITLLLSSFLLLFDIFYINKHFYLFDYIKNNCQESNFIKEHYVHPNNVKISFPKQKRNLIIIQVESLENSVQDKKNGGFFDVNYIPHLTEIAKNNINFSHSELLEGATVLPGTGWTISGLVAETAGLPLKLYGKNYKKIDNSMNKYSKFLPGIISLGDILERNGYKNVFILGTGKEFAGQENYMKQHGDYLIYDRSNIGKNKKDQSDKKVFEFSKNKITELSKNKHPFHLIIQTFDTHFSGYNSKSCSPSFTENFKNGYFCVDSLINDFMNWLKHQDFYSNTTIVILGDHCSHSNDIASHIEILNHNDMSSRHNGNITRKVYNAFINSAQKPISMHHRKFSTIDMFPTILASIGVKIEGEKLGLGTNLFSNKKTLPEIYGYGYIFQELKKKSLFYNHFLLY